VLLKEAGREYTVEAFEFLQRNKAAMQRTTLQYLIELMLKEMRAESMRKG